MTATDFYSLPRAVQDRLLDSLSGRFVPRPIALKRGARPLAVLWLAGSIVSCILFISLMMVGYGDVGSSFALQPTAMAVVYILLAAAAVGSALTALALRMRREALPFKPGLYLFPANLIDARQPKLKVHPVTALAGASAAGNAVRVQFASGTFTLPVKDPSQVQAALSAIESARITLAGEVDARHRFELDPLEAPSVTSPLAPTTPLTRRAPIWEKLRWVIAAAAGVVIGVGLFGFRNARSDHRMLAAVQARNDIAGYESYLARGEAHREQVQSVLLPRARLAEAVKQGSVEAIDGFIKAHPETGIASEVDHARRAALVAEFERVRAKGTLAALLDFEARHPDHGIGAPHDDAKRALYKKTLARVQARMPEESSAREFAGRLLAYAERVGPKQTPAGPRGPTVKIRVQRVPSETLERAKGAVSKNPMFNGTRSYPGEYFQPEDLAPYEKAVTDKLGSALNKAFEPEILVFEPGAALPPDQDAPKDLKTAELWISYRVEWSGGAFASKKPRGILVGLLVFFRTAFFIPKDEDPLTTKYTLSENVPHEVLERFRDGQGKGVLEEEVYKFQTQDAFNQFEQHYLSRWFKQPVK